MRKLAIAVLMTAWAGMANAGVYHYGKYLFCYDCHSMHGSQQHGFEDSSAPSTDGALKGNWLPIQGSANLRLLKGAGESETCIACHDGRNFAPDVVGADANTTNDRSGGALPDGTAEYAEFKGHTLSETPALAPGQTTAANVLTCTRCHSAHGNGPGFRNISSVPFTFQGDAIPTVAQRLFSVVILNQGDGAAPANKQADAPYVPTLQAPFNGYYNGANVRFYAQGTQTSAGAGLTNLMNMQCANCHGMFHGAPQASGAMGNGTVAAGVGGSWTTSSSGSRFSGFVRHPTTGVFVRSTPNAVDTALGSIPSSFYNTTGSHVKVAWGLQSQAAALPTAWSTAGYTGDIATPMCISCHNAHGSKNAFGLKFLNVSIVNADLENGNGTYRNLCGQCHTQGAYFTDTYPGTYTGANP